MQELDLLVQELLSKLLDKIARKFQKSEFLQECGMVDVIAKREDLKETIFKVLNNII